MLRNLFFVILLATTSTSIVSAQNLVSNASFEQVSTCILGGGWA